MRRSTVNAVRRPIATLVTSVIVMVASVAVIARPVAAGPPMIPSPETTTPSTDAPDAQDEPTSGTSSPVTTGAEPSATSGPPTTLEASTSSEPTSTESTPADPTSVDGSVSPGVRRSDIPIGTIALSIAVLAGVAFGARRLIQRDAAGHLLRAAHLAADSDGANRHAADPDAPPDPETVPFLIELGRALINSSSSVGDVEAELLAIARTNGIRDLDVIVFPTALMVSVAEREQIVTQVGTAGDAKLRLDQIDDITHLVNDARRGTVRPAEARTVLSHVLAAPAPNSTAAMLAGYALSSAGLALVLHGGWRGVALALALGAVVGLFRLRTVSLGGALTPFWPLIAATTSAVVVFAAARVSPELIIFPALVAPIIMFLPGALLTTGVLELATGHIVAGASRIASGGMQLVLLALGIVAGAQLVGVPTTDLDSGATYAISALAPWVGVAVFSIGVSWFNSAHRAAQLWIMVVLFVGYAGQVIGGLFFGSALSAFFGALAMTPVAVLASHQPSGPAPLVTFLPGFWLLVPGALGLEGVTRILDSEGYNAADVLITTLTSMVGISLGILLGLTVATRNRTLVEASGPAES